MRTIFSIKSLLIAAVVVVLGSCTELGGLLNEDMTKGSLASRAMDMRGHDVAYCDSLLTEQGFAVEGSLNETGLTVWSREDVGTIKRELRSNNYVSIIARVEFDNYRTLYARTWTYALEDGYSKEADFHAYLDGTDYSSVNDFITALGEVKSLEYAIADISEDAQVGMFEITHEENGYVFRLEIRDPYQK